MKAARYVTLYLYDDIYFEFLEKAKLWRREADQWLPGVGGGSKEGRQTDARELFSDGAF